MFSFLSSFFAEKNIDCWGSIPLSSCHIIKPYLLERTGIGNGSVVLFAVPYLTEAGMAQDRNLSAYAVPRDYHGFFKQLFDELLPLLSSKFPNARFAGFADHSPIAEIDAASRAGLGVIGKNNLLLTPKYSSYVFLGEIVTDILLDCSAKEPAYCEDCGACTAACPKGTCGECLSALTQKKGELREAEKEVLIRHGSVWGCDLCQEVCPHTKRAIASKSIFSPIPYFRESNLAHLTQADLDAMSDVELASRAYAWRGRETIGRNLMLIENEKNKKGAATC